MRLRVLLGDHPHTFALKSKAIESDLVTLEFVDYSPTNTGFKPMVRDASFDVSEMAIVTYLMAKSFDKPMVLLPSVMMARFQHSYAICNVESGIVEPKDLEGKRVGIRSFTTTTGAWLRGILETDYGVDLNALHWTTFEAPHVAEYNDATVRALAGEQILQMLFKGELDAVLGERSDDIRVRPLFSDIEAAEKAWFDKNGVVPVNHMVVVGKQISESRPDVVREVFRLLEASRVASGVAGMTDESLSRSLSLITTYAANQRLIPRAYTVDELYDDVTNALR